MEQALIRIKNRFGRALSILGPGLITGAADDDPSGIATYSQTGAQYGYGQLWTAVFMLPFQTAVQEACARIGAVSGRGIAGVVKDYYSPRLLYPIVALVVVANTINIGADIGAMAAAAALVIPVNFVILTLIFTATILCLEIFTSYRVYARILKWFALALLSYPLTIAILHIPWSTVARATFIPHIELNFDFIFIITGVLGTTISPYMFFWQSSEEVEEEHAHHMISHLGYARVNWHFIKRMRLDNLLGMVASEIGTWSIIVVAATVLHTHGIYTVRTASDAARALEPLVSTFPNAGYIAKCIFAIGIVGLGLLAVPVLSGSASYAVSEAANWKHGLNLKLKRAHGFYGVITIATLIGLIINFVGIDPVQALVYTAVFNGIAAVPLLVIIALIAEDEVIMGEYRSGVLSRVLVWSTAGGMMITAIALGATYFMH